MGRLSLIHSEVGVKGSLGLKDLLVIEAFAGEKEDVDFAEHRYKNGLPGFVHLSGSQPSMQLDPKVFQGAYSSPLSTKPSVAIQPTVRQRSQPQRVFLVTDRESCRYRLEVVASLRDSLFPVFTQLD